MIVAAYNQPRPIGLVLAALDAQTDTQFDVVIADDGSNPPVAELLDTLRPGLSFPVTSVWHEDDGFRKARAENLAALATEAELLIFLDGDTLPFRNMVEVYRQRFHPNEFMVGGWGRLDEETSRALTPASVRDGAHERALLLAERLHLLRVHVENLISSSRQARPRIRGGNFAVPAALFRRVDGYDETFCGFGKEDSDLRNRLRNAGARGRSLWHRALAVTLARSVAPSGSRRAIPRETYEAGRLLVQARIGMSSHTVTGTRPAAPSRSSGSRSC